MDAATTVYFACKVHDAKYTVASEQQDLVRIHIRTRTVECIYRVQYLNQHGKIHDRSPTWHGDIPPYINFNSRRCRSTR